MLFLTIVWSGLIFVSFAIGAAILSLIKNECFERIGDRLIVAVWLGVLILAVSLLAASLFVPLSPLVGAAIAVSLVAIALCFHRTRTEIIALGSVLLPRQIWGFLTLEIAVAAYAARAITWFDTGLYHFQVIRWLSRFGTVPGLALIHARFGFTSSWFALAAPLNAGIFEARIGAVVGGFTFLLGVLQVIISAARLLKHQQRFEDWFVVFFSFFCLPMIVAGGLPTSSSPDVPVILLTGIVSWTFIIICSTSKRINSAKHITLEPEIIPLLLSAGATTVKLSAFPLLIVSGCFYIFRKRFSWQRILFCCAIASLLLLPMLSFGIITSGCPLFPSSLLCLNLPWSFKLESVKAVSKSIQDWNRWGGSAPDYANSWNWLGHWIFDEKLAILLIAWSVVSVFLLIRSSKKFRFPAQNYVITLASLGIAYMMYGAPSLRFGLGYLCLLPAVSLACYSHLGSPPIATAAIDRIVRSSQNKITFNIFIVIISAIVVVLPLKNLLFNLNDPTSILLPPKMQVPTKLLGKQVNDVSYTTPLTAGQDERCWAAELPCTPENLENVKFRQSKLGIAAGFRRSD